MPAAKKWSGGTLLKRGNADGPPETFTSIAWVDNLQGPSVASDIIDVTTLDTSTNYEEDVVGLLRGGEVTCDLKFAPDDTGHANLIADQVARATKNFQIYFPSATPKTASFAAYVIKLQPKAAIKDALTAALTLRISGAVTWA